MHTTFPLIRQLADRVLLHKEEEKHKDPYIRTFPSLLGELSVKK
jgi:hypothetical protein